MNKVLSAVFVALSLLSACSEENHTEVIRFATSAEYPPFEYRDGDEVKGFDIDLARAIAAKLGKTAVFEDMQFSTVLAALQSGTVDAAISTISITEERKKSFDFSKGYYTESLSVVYPLQDPVSSIDDLNNKTIACQLGSTMEIWLREHVPSANIMAMDNNNQAIEALKAGHVDLVLIDSIQAVEFSARNPVLGSSVISYSDTGYGIAFPKGSPLHALVDQALTELEESGELAQLKQKWLGDSAWKS
ncbi:transporter substrate-binding domain-containing protein [Haematospirillum jordaniae]|uniref:substrate-binding periplasmic protein n=1 Tax=Haematospirillum jordaniae TaxID=1549855 RepID=UPI001432E605|nr:transporter substrate-binding domain-containing protein [Haematospirillum jordaniae]NKD85131.1 transporter substrate-binding domain-containing protein [Haematospirillum jordaniae]